MTKTILYRGTQGSPAARPAIMAGTWLTPDADVAAWYGCAHRYEVPEMRTLDLRRLGVGDGEDPAQRNALRVALADAGVSEIPWRILAHPEIYMVAEDPDFQDLAREAGYEAVRVMQWHASRSDEPYEAILVLEDL